MLRSLVGSEMCIRDSSDALTAFLDEINGEEEDKDHRRKLLDYNQIFSDVRKNAENAVRRNERKKGVTFVDEELPQEQPNDDDDDDEDDDDDDLKAGFVTRQGALERSSRALTPQIGNNVLNRSDQSVASFGVSSRPTSTGRPTSHQGTSSGQGRVGIGGPLPPAPPSDGDDASEEDEHEGSKLNKEFSFPREEVVVPMERQNEAATKIQCAHRQRMARVDVNQRRTAIRARNVQEAEAALIAAQKDEDALRDAITVEEQADRNLIADELQNGSAAASDAADQKNNAALRIQCAHRQRMARADVNQRRTAIRARNVQEAEAALIAAQKDEDALRDAITVEEQADRNLIADELQNGSAAASDAADQKNNAALRIQCAHRQRMARADVAKRRLASAEEEPTVYHSPSPPARVQSARTSRYERFLARAESCPVPSSLVASPPVTREPLYIPRRRVVVPVPPRMTGHTGVNDLTANAMNRDGLAENASRMIGKLKAFTSDADHRREVRYAASHSPRRHHTSKITDNGSSSTRGSNTSGASEEEGGSGPSSSSSPIPIGGQLPSIGLSISSSHHQPHVPPKPKPSSLSSFPTLHNNNNNNKRPSLPTIPASTNTPQHSIAITTSASVSYTHLTLPTKRIV
eukprot:TRINITY_DN1643_c0_g1_i7.p1 TRINITY_DN1643_c0_g1~~TRINITY_DN1643_c0_g1_i7.p1  ORF type:complete len:673 (-),score=159.37 TRINITY_DN1643_c0_g1_i7:115-2019(-)